MTVTAVLIVLASLACLAYVVVKLGVVPFGMMALTEGRNTPERDGESFVFPVAASVECFEGSLIVLDSAGNAKPGVTGTGLIAAGRCEEYVDNSSGAAADVTVKVKAGIFRFENSAAGDAITKAQIGDACFIVDDQTVAKTSDTGTRSVAGYIVDVDTDGVWVKVNPIQSADGDLVAANNLSDVANAGTSRANIGANKVVLSLQAKSLVGTTVYGIVSPVAGTISKIHSVLKGAALTTGNATLTGKIGGTAITTGVITITQAGSAIGDKDDCTPSALNVVAIGDEIQFLVGGTNDAAAAFAEVSMLIET